MYYARVEDERVMAKKTPIGGIPPKRSLKEALADAAWLQALIAYSARCEVQVRF